MGLYTSNGGHFVSLEAAAQPTYFATGTGYTAYATPTDLFTISGASNKIVKIVLMRLLVQTTSGALQTVHWIKRGTANTGGTATQPTGFAMDSVDPAHSATINLYTAAPTTGDVVGRNYNSVLTTATTAVPGIFTGVNLLTTQSTTFAKTITLRGANESFCCNWNGAALPAGFTATWEVQWTESPA